MLQRIAILVQGMNAGVYDGAMTFSPNKQTKYRDCNACKIKTKYMGHSIICSKLQCAVSTPLTSSYGIAKKMI